MPLSTLLRAVLTAATLGAVPGAEPVTIYIGPMERDGFVDADKGVLDSVKDLKNNIRGKREFQVVQTKEAATLHFFVVKRFRGADLAGAAIPVGGITMVLPVEGKAVQCLLRVGTHEKGFVAEDDTWGDAAGKLVNDLRVWLQVNRERLPKQP